MADGRHRFKYVLLEDKNADRRAELPGYRGDGPFVKGDDESFREVPPELNVIAAELSVQEAADARRSRKVVHMAREMPLALIEPMVSESSAGFIGDVTWGVEAVKAAASSYDGEPVTVAVLDTGIDVSHPAFLGVALERKNFTSASDDDTHGHGTHCAGTIFGRDIEDGGTMKRIGVAPGVRRALIGKVIGPGAGTAALTKAIRWAAEEGAHVISMSLGYDHAGLLEDLQDYYPTKRAASELLTIYIENIRQFDALLHLLRMPVQGRPSPLIIAASGNESEAGIAANAYRISSASPSSALGVVSVGALQMNGSGKLKVAPFSNTNVDVSAPGVGVVSAKVGGGLTSMNGTSMACPHVAGVAALRWHHIFAAGLPRTADTVLHHLVANADRGAIDPAEILDDYGAGLPVAP